VSAIPSWLLKPLWDQFSALLPVRPVYDPAHPLGCHRPRISDRIIFEKLIQVLRFGCSYVSIADCTCGATTIRERRDEWIKAGIFARLKAIARDAYDRMVGLVLDELAIDGCIAKAPGGGEVAGRSPVDRGKLGYKRSLMVVGKGIPLGRVLAPANRHDSPLLAPTLGPLDEISPLPEEITVHLDAGYDSQKTRDELESRSITWEIAHKGRWQRPVAGLPVHLRKPGAGQVAAVHAGANQGGDHPLDPCALPGRRGGVDDRLQVGDLDVLAGDRADNRDREPLAQPALGVRVLS
jgi:transposase